MSCLIAEIPHSTQGVVDEVVERYKKISRIVRKGANFDMSKCFIDGKPLIVEGSNLDPPIFLEPKEGGDWKLITPDPED